MHQNTTFSDVSQNFNDEPIPTSLSIYNYFSNFSETTFKSLMPHLWVLLLTLFFIALPLIAYLAYKHGRKTATTAIPQAVRDAYYYFGPSAQRTQKISPDSSFEMSRRSESKNSSTNSSPSLGPVQRSRNNSLTNRIISPNMAPMIEKRESSVQTQEEDFEEMNLEGFDSEQVASSSLTNFQNKDKPSPKVSCQGTTTNHDDLNETDIVLKNKTSQITINSNGRKSFSQEKENSSSFMTEKLQRLQEEQNFETIIQKYGLPHETGKFQKIFQSLEWIGEGSFGQVQKVVHCLDGRVYAVKKVRVNLEKFEHLKTKSKVFREVFAMTDLHHANIVRYFTCWIEIETIVKEHTHNKQLQHISESGDSDNEQEDSNDSFDQFKSKSEDISSSSNMGFEWDVSSKSIQKSPKNNIRFKPKKPAHPKPEKFLLQSISKTFVEDSKDGCLAASASCQNESQSNQDFQLYLYIQMEYCSGQSLKYFLDNPERIIEHKKSICMFKKVVEGVKAIHSKGIIHRDLKPANIFLDGEGNVKIGDFGLALLNKTEESSSKPVGEVKLALNRVHSMKVGTPMYTSPEQEAGGHYDERTDIYSLGLIFYEMLVSFSTGHERYIHFNMIKHEHKLPESFMKHFEKESLLILNMTCKEPQNRPTLEELLQKL